MIDRLVLLGKAMIGVFVFITCTLLWFWAIDTWEVVPVWLAITYTGIALLCFDRMLNKWWLK